MGKGVVLLVPAVEIGWPGASLAGHNQFCAELAAVIDTKQSMPQFTLLEDRPAQKIAETLFQGGSVDLEVDEANVVEPADVEQGDEIAPGKAVLMRQRDVEAGIRARPLHVRCTQQ